MTSSNRTWMSRINRMIIAFRLYISVLANLCKLVFLPSASRSFQFSTQKAGLTLANRSSSTPSTLPTTLPSQPSSKTVNRILYDAPTVGPSSLPQPKCDDRRPEEGEIVETEPPRRKKKKRLAPRGGKQWAKNHRGQAKARAKQRVATQLARSTERANEEASSDDTQVIKSNPYVNGDAQTASLIRKTDAGTQGSSDATSTTAGMENHIRNEL